MGATRSLQRAIIPRAVACAAVTVATDLAFAGLARQAELIAAGELSSRELTELYLERIARLDPTLNAFRVVVRRARAGRGRPGRRPPPRRRRRARCSASRSRSRTTSTSPARSPPTAATPTASPRRADAEVVRRLRTAGAVIIGKTNVPELMITPFTESPTFGVTRNPWDLHRTPGGSSGGSAAAVAAGLVGAALGSDGAGSIRIPAGCCGLFGLKPQRGRVPTAPLRGAVARPVGLRRRHPPRRRQRALLRRHQATASRSPPPRPRRPASCGSRSRRHAAAHRRAPDAEQRGALDDMARAAARARPRGRRARDPVRHRRGTAFTARYLRGDRRRGGRAAAPRAPLAPHARLPADSARAIPDAAARRARARRRPPTRARSAAVFERRRRRADADVHRAARPRSAPTRAAARCGRSTATSRLVPYCAAVQPHRPAGRVGARRLHRRRLPARRAARRPPDDEADAALARRPARGARAPWAGPAARRCDRARCARSPRRSRARRAPSCARRSPAELRDRDARAARPTSSPRPTTPPSS